MGKVYLAWALYVAVLGAHSLYWRLAPTSLALRRAGVAADIVAQAFWLAVATQVSLFAWPFVAAAKLEAMEQPHVLSILLLTFGCVAASFAVAATVGAMWGIAVKESTSPDQDLRVFGTVVTGAAIIGTIVTYYVALT